MHVIPCEPSLVSLKLALKKDGPKWNLGEFWISAEIMYARLVEHYSNYRMFMNFATLNIFKPGLMILND